MMKMSSDALYGAHFSFSHAHPDLRRTALRSSQSVGLWAGPLGGSALPTSWAESPALGPLPAPALHTPSKSLTPAEPSPDCWGDTGGPHILVLALKKQWGGRGPEGKELTLK